jgi:pantoate--beta-alanine ligase
MRIATTRAEIRRQLASHRDRCRIALTPTMGCLHEGHLSLIRKAKSLADIVVVSIYVNPLQFGPNEDLDRYPRTFEADAALCEQEGVDFIFHPASLYPAGGPKVTLKAEGLSDCLCGSSRPGHFDGVVTAVNILFNIIQPNLAVFGEKDWQQLSIIRRMVQDLQMPVDIVSSETVREDDGLAMSSRNRYLSKQDRRKAVQLSLALSDMQNLAANGESNASVLLASALARLAGSGVRPDYLEIRQANSLKVKRKLNESRNIRAFVAATVGKTRLIDNMPLRIEHTDAAEGKTEMRT